MGSPDSLARRSSLLRAVRACLWLGAGLDLGFAACLVALPGRSPALLGLPAPGTAFYPRLAALPLALLAVLRLSAAYDVYRYAAVIWAAILLHWLALLAFTAAGALPLAGIEGLLGAVLLGTWWPARR